MYRRIRRLLPIAVVILAADALVRTVLNGALPDSLALEIVADALAVALLAAPLIWFIVDVQIASTEEAAALRADARFAAVLATSIDAILTTDEHGTVTRFNAGAEEIFGYAAAEVVGRDLGMLIPPGARTLHAGLLAGFARGADASRVMGTTAAVVGLRKDGSRFPADVSISRVDLDDAVVLTAILRDTTERRRAEAALRDSEASLRAVLRSVPMVIWATDANGIITLAEGRGRETPGFDPRRLVGKRAFDIFRSVECADGTGAVLSSHDVLRGALSGGSLRGRSTIGAGHFEYHVAPSRAPDGGIVGSVGVVIDVTERVRLEESRRRSDTRFRTIFEQAPLGMALVDSSTARHVSLNPRYAAIVGRTVDEVMALDWMQVTHPDDIAADLEERTRMIARESDGYALDKRMLRPDGSAVWVRLTVAPVPGEPGARGWHLSMLEDISERRAAHAEFERTAGRLRGLSLRFLTVQDEERSALGRELHDEIGQALGAAKINLQSLQRFPDPKSRGDRIGESLRIVDRALAQVRAMSLALHPPLLEDAGLAVAARWLVEETARRSGIGADFRCPAALPRFDGGTEMACFRIMQGALSNVERHAACSRVVVELEMREQELRLTVSDDGVGFGVGEAYTLAYTGASLGLIGMEERALLAGGDIEWRSTPGEGTEVRAWFPVVRSPEEVRREASS